MQDLERIAWKETEHALRRKGREVALRCTRCALVVTPDMVRNGELPQNWWRCPRRIRKRVEENT